MTIFLDDFRRVGEMLREAKRNEMDEDVYL